MCDNFRFKLLSLASVLALTVGPVLARPGHLEERLATSTTSCPTRCLEFPNNCGGTWETCIPSCTGQSIPTFTPPPCSSSTSSCPTLCIDFMTNSCGGLWGTCVPYCSGDPFPTPTAPPCTGTPTSRPATTTTTSCPQLCFDFATNSCGEIWGTCIPHCPGNPIPTPTEPPCTRSPTSRPPTTTSSRSTTTSDASCATPTEGEYPYFLSEIKHQGLYHLNSSYPVFRNVKCWGAKGDGVTDDTGAIVRALTEGKLCTGSNCQNYYVPPSLVYFPYGDYLVSRTLPIYRNTQVLGSALQRPIIRSTDYSFQGPAIFDTKVKESVGGGVGDFITIKNFAILGHRIPGNRNVAAIRWNAGHASGIYNIQTTMSYDPINSHRGILVLNTPHIFMSEIFTDQGDVGIEMAAQAGTLSNVASINAKSAGIRVTSSYSLTLKHLYLYNTPIGIDASKVVGNPSIQAVNSLVIMEGEISFSKVFIKTARGGSSKNPPGGGSIVIERFKLGSNIVGVQRDNGVNVYNPSPSNTNRGITLWAQGRRYTPPDYKVATMQNPITPLKFSQPLLRTETSELGNFYLERSQPSGRYLSFKAADFISVRSAGIKGDGITDDTAKLQRVFDQAAASGRPVFVDYGIYIVSRTLLIKPGTRIVGEVWPKFLAAGHFWVNPKTPRPVFQIGRPGDSGMVEIQDILVSTKAMSTGAISFQWNLKGPNQYGETSGMWSTHSVIGAQPFSGLEAAQCAHNSVPGTRPRGQCIGGFMHLHITRYAQNVYLENNYYGSAAYQSVTPAPSQPLSVYVARGVLIDNCPGPIWLSSISSENSVMYQWQIQNSANIYASALQGTNPSFQSNPAAPAPFTTNTTLSDPNFSTICAAHTGAAYAKCAKAFGLRVINSDNINIYSTSFLAGQDNYSASCPGGQFNCQLAMIGVEKQKRSPVDKFVNIHGLTVRGARYALLLDGKIVIDSQVNAGTSLALPVVAWWYVGGELPS